MTHKYVRDMSEKTYDRRNCREGIENPARDECPRFIAVHPLHQILEKFRTDPFSPSRHTIIPATLCTCGPDICGDYYTQDHIILKSDRTDDTPHLGPLLVESPAGAFDLVTGEPE